MRISDWSSDVCSSDLRAATLAEEAGIGVDLHTDETLNPDSLDIVDLARRTADWPAEMTRSAGHCVSLAVQPRWEERSAGKECVSTCRSRWSPYHYTKRSC